MTHTLIVTFYGRILLFQNLIKSNKSRAIQEIYYVKTLKRYVKTLFWIDLLNFVVLVKD